MRDQGQHTTRSRTRTHKLVIGGVLIAVLVMLVTGLAVVRLRRSAAEVSPTGATATATVAEPEPVMAAESSTTVAMPAEVIPAEEAAARVEPVAKPAPKGEPAAPSKALASAVVTSTRVAECATSMTAAVNADPTNGEISGASGLPDQVTYFKPRGYRPPCPSLARSATESP